VDHQKTPARTKINWAIVGTTQTAISFPVALIFFGLTEVSSLWYVETAYILRTIRRILMAQFAVISTSFGDIEFELLPAKAPKTVKNFVNLAKQGFYNKTIFHRIDPEFMIQGGDPNTKDPGKSSTYGQGGPGYNIKDEFNDTQHKKGVVSMANTGKPNSAGSQFFICVVDSPDLDGKYTAFGRVTSGLDAVEKIANLPRTGESPNDRTEMTVTIVEK
jgi:peptidyl-prolyl cis-trans isomerase B (cyclophilin B)